VKSFSGSGSKTETLKVHIQNVRTPIQGSLRRSRRRRRQCSRPTYETSRCLRRIPCVWINASLNRCSYRGRISRVCPSTPSCHPAKRRSRQSRRRADIGIHRKLQGVGTVDVRDSRRRILREGSNSCGSDCPCACAACLPRLVGGGERSGEVHANRVTDTHGFAGISW